jgi:urease accessory protein UreF
MTSRERFEKWLAERFPHSYTSRFAPTMFIAWQAAEKQAFERAMEAVDEAGARPMDVDAIRALMEPK